MMIISDLEYIEVTAKIADIEGSLALFDFNLEFLALGSLMSITNISRAEFLTTESPGVNVSSGKFTISMMASGLEALELGGILGL